MTTLEQLDLQEKMAKLKAKWPKPPDKLSSEYFKYRADRCLWLSYNQKLNSAKKYDST